MERQAGKLAGRMEFENELDFTSGG
jgi:hypothetical protein